MYVSDSLRIGLYESGVSTTNMLRYMNVFPPERLANKDAVRWDKAYMIQRRSFNDSQAP